MRLNTVFLKNDAFQLSRTRVIKLLNKRAIISNTFDPRIFVNDNKNICIITCDNEHNCILVPPQTKITDDDLQKALSYLCKEKCFENLPLIITTTRTTTTRTIKNRSLFR